jgi:hypothetical protein
MVHWPSSDLMVLDAGAAMVAMSFLLVCMLYLPKLVEVCKIM